MMGEYFVTKNADPICVPFTRNLNQFRRLDFDACHPRLSEKYPQFSRPAWEGIPFDLTLAETIFKNLRLRRRVHTPSTGGRSGSGFLSHSAQLAS